MAVVINDSILIADLQCFAPVNYYVGLVYFDKLKFEQYEHFRKGSYSNRYYVAGSNGKILLSIPLLHAHRERLPFRDLKICNRNRWQLLHWRTLTSAYRRSPWFEFYEGTLHLMYNKNFKYLMDWNLEAFELVNDWLGLFWKISFTDEYRNEYSEPDIVDARNRISPQNHLLEFSANVPRYHQVFEDRTGFLPGLSILDLIFCEGKRAASLLQWGVSSDNGDTRPDL